MTDDRDEAIRRGLELQAELPTRPGWRSNRREPSEGAQIVGATPAAIVGYGWPWGVLAVIPAALIWLARRLRQRP